jgi:hypothetical protein
VVKYPSGLDVEWIAADRKGLVGVFTTAAANEVAALVQQLESRREISIAGSNITYEWPKTT